MQNMTSYFYIPLVPVVPMIAPWSTWVQQKPPVPEQILSLGGSAGYVPTLGNLTPPDMSGDSFDWRQALKMLSIMFSYFGPEIKGTFSCYWKAILLLSAKFGDASVAKANNSDNLCIIFNDYRKILDGLRLDNPVNQVIPQKDKFQLYLCLTRFLIRPVVATLCKDTKAMNNLMYVKRELNHRYIHHLYFEYLCAITRHHDKPVQLPDRCVTRSEILATQICANYLPFCKQDWRRFISFGDAIKISELCIRVFEDMVKFYGNMPSIISSMSFRSIYDDVDTFFRSYFCRETNNLMENGRLEEHITVHGWRDPDDTAIDVKTDVLTQDVIKYVCDYNSEFSDLLKEILWLITGTDNIASKKCPHGTCKHIPAEMYAVVQECIPIDPSYGETLISEYRETPLYIKLLQLVGKAMQKKIAMDYPIWIQQLLRYENMTMLSCLQHIYITTMRYVQLIVDPSKLSTFDLILLRAYYGPFVAAADLPEPHSEERMKFIGSNFLISPNTFIMILPRSTQMLLAIRMQTGNDVLLPSYYSMMVRNNPQFHYLN